MENDEKKILSIDAGGAKGIYSLFVMAGMEDRFKIDFNKGFDYYTGTSIGGVIAAALAYGVSPGEILTRFVLAQRRSAKRTYLFIAKAIRIGSIIYSGKSPSPK